MDLQLGEDIGIGDGIWGWEGMERGSRGGREERTNGERQREEWWCEEREREGERDIVWKSSERFPFVIRFFGFLEEWRFRLTPSLVW